MSTTIYDSSLLTQRRQQKAQSGSFLARQALSQTGYAAPLGIYDQSIIQTVKMGQMTTYQKNSSGFTKVDQGCPSCGQ